MCTHNYVLNKNMENIEFYQVENFNFYRIKNCCMPVTMGMFHLKRQTKLHSSTRQ